MTAVLNTHEENDIQMSMMLTAIGQSMAYGEIDTAKKLQSMAMDWVKASDQRGEIYKNFAVVAGWTGTSSGLL